MSNPPRHPRGNCEDHEGRIRDLERWRDRCDGSKPALKKRLDEMNNEIKDLAALLRERDAAYNVRFDKITRTIAWAAGALSALVFFTQVMLPALRAPEPAPQVIHIAPLEPGTSAPGD